MQHRCSIVFFVTLSDSSFAMRETDYVSISSHMTTNDLGCNNSSEKYPHFRLIAVRESLSVEFANYDQLKHLELVIGLIDSQSEEDHIEQSSLINSA